MACLKANGMRADAEPCRKLSAAYLQCRMDACAFAPRSKRFFRAASSRRTKYIHVSCFTSARRSLMAPTEVEKLGFRDGGAQSDAAARRAEELASQARAQTRRGFVAGVPATKPPESSDTGR